MQTPFLAKKSEATQQTRTYFFCLRPLLPSHKLDKINLLLHLCRQISSSPSLSFTFPIFLVYSAVITEEINDLIFPLWNLKFHVYLSLRPKWTVHPPLELIVLLPLASHCSWPPSVSNNQHLSLSAIIQSYGALTVQSLKKKKTLPFPAGI